MTDQSDRPDGDGLRTCPCCDGPSEASTAFDGSVYEGHVIICANGKCGCQSGVFPTPAMARKAWNTRAPARDGAEGADPFTYGIDHCVHDERNRAAPPKPAPAAPHAGAAEPVAGERERISFPREWVQQIRDGLFAVDKLPPGPLGDWAFLFREQLNDALSRQAPHSSSEDGR